VGIGPGSFIGTRTAISFANGFAAAADVELFAVNSLAAIAAGMGSLPPPPVIRDARRGQWYLWLSDAECSAFDDEGVLSAIADTGASSVVLESSAHSEPALAVRLRSSGVQVELSSGVTGEGLLRASGSASPEPYIEPIYLRGFT